MPEKIDLSDIKQRDELFVDFITKLLDIDPYRRLSAEEALNHEWLNTN